MEVSDNIRKWKTSVVRMSIEDSHEDSLTNVHYLLDVKVNLPESSNT